MRQERVHVRGRGRWVLAAVAAVGIAAATMVPSGAATVSLPTEFTSGGVRWGDLTFDGSGFWNEGELCTDNAFAMEDALLLPDKNDAFDGAGMVTVGGEPYLVPGGLNGPVDLTGARLTTPAAPVGGLQVSVEWQGAGPGTIREIVAFTNSGAASVTQLVTLENNLGSDGNTELDATSSGDISGYPTSARWFATHGFSELDPNPDPPILSVVTGPGTVRSPGTVAECVSIDSAGADEKDETGASRSSSPEPAAVPEPTTSTTTASDVSAEAVDAPPATVAAGEAAPAGDVDAAGTLLGTDEFNYGYVVDIPAGETRYVMVFWTLDATIDGAVAAGPTWNVNPAEGSEALAGTTREVLCRVVNWDFGSCLAFTG